MAYGIGRNASEDCGRFSPGDLAPEKPVARVFAALCATLLVAACVGPAQVRDARLSGPKDGDLQRILAAPRPPAIITPAGEAPRLSQRSVARLSVAALSEQRGARPVEIAAVPMLRSTGAGATYLAMEGHRALAQGEPAASCPALAAASPGAPSAQASAIDALGACAAQLSARAAAPTCGCRLIALDDALLAPIERFSFASAVSALLIDGGRATRLIAEAELADGVAITRLRDATGEIGVLRKEVGEETVSGEIGGVTYTGLRQPFGFRRGRLAERIIMTDADGAEISLLVGVERRDATP